MAASIWSPGTVLQVNADTTLRMEVFTLSEPQSVFNLSAFQYTPDSGSLLVFVNGISQASGIDFAETDLDTITFFTALNAGDFVAVYGFVGITATLVGGGATGGVGSVYFASTVTGTADNISATITGYAIYSAGDVVNFVAAANNTSAVTLSINGIGAKSVLTSKGAALIADTLVSGAVYQAIYTGATFRLVDRDYNSISFPAPIAISATGANDITLATNGVTRLVLGATGNIGLGVTPSVLWDPALQVISTGAKSSVVTLADGSVEILHNVIKTDANYTRAAIGTASRIHLTITGNIQLYNAITGAAGSTISWIALTDFNSNWSVNAAGTITSPSLVSTAVASSVNYVESLGAITAVAPTIKASGADTNIGLKLQAKGTGVISAVSPIDATGGFYIAGSLVTSSAAELNYTDVTTAGVAQASKALILGINKNTDTLVIADGGLKLGSGAGTAVTATAVELNYVDITTIGVAQASKAAILDANKSIDTIGMPVGGLRIGAGAGTAVTSSAAELNKLTGVTATAAKLNYVDVATIGTAEPSKSLVLDLTKSAGGLGNISATPASGVALSGTAIGNVGVFGTSNTVQGVIGQSTSGQGVLATSSSGPGLRAESGTGTGAVITSVSGTGATINTTTTTALSVQSTSGLTLYAQGTGDVIQATTGTGIAVFGNTTSGIGVSGFASSGTAVHGQCNGAGFAVRGVATDGIGVAAESDTTTPARAAFRIVPQDAIPTGPNLVGDIYVTTAGVLKVCTVLGSPGTWVSVGSQV